MSAPFIAPAPDALVTRWLDAFTARDVEGMLAGVHPQARFQPLRPVPQTSRGLPLSGPCFVRFAPRRSAEKETALGGGHLAVRGGLKQPSQPRSGSCHVALTYHDREIPVRVSQDVG